MGVVNAIYQAPIIREACLDTTGETRVTIRYNGYTYTGYANLHPEDSEFFSPRVGKRIATSRARAMAMKAELKRLDNEYKVLRNFYISVNSKQDYTATLLNRKLQRLMHRGSSLKLAIRREKANLRAYLASQNKALETIKQMRQQDKTN